MLGKDELVRRAKILERAADLVEIGWFVGSPTARYSAAARITSTATAPTLRYREAACAR